LLQSGQFQMLPDLRPVMRTVIDDVGKYIAQLILKNFSFRIPITN